MDPFDPNAVEAYSKTTGRKQTIPRHWLKDEVLGADFSLTPSAKAREVVDVETDDPDEAWTIAQLRDRADRDGIDLSGRRLKVDILAAVLAGPQPPTEDGTPTDTTTNPDPSNTDTPGSGDEE